MRGVPLTEVASSLLLAAMTGISGFGGLALADYAFLAFRPSLNATGLALMLFGIVNLPLFILWSRQSADELAARAVTRGRCAHGNEPAAH